MYSDGLNPGSNGKKREQHLWGCCSLFGITIENGCSAQHHRSICRLLWGCAGLSSQDSASARSRIFFQVASSTGTPSASACACFLEMSRPGI